MIRRRNGEYTFFSNIVVDKLLDVIKHKVN
jgi:hypothetical protein